jgi:glyoxylase-like metal-dependent hydrolase (beta-lactamase superfamily II)
LVCSDATKFRALAAEVSQKTIYLHSPIFQKLIRMKIQTFTVGMLSTNCYVAICQETKNAVLIDPGFDSSSEAGLVFRFVDEASLKVNFIINTHGHPDHIAGNNISKKKHSVPICIHEYDAGATDDVNEKTLPANVLLKDGNQIRFGDATLKIMHTPGHTPGSICLLDEKLVFTGDTLFAGGIGRTDLTGGSYRDMKLSLEKLLRLPDGLVVYPGHGPSTTIGTERRVNPFLRWL